MALDETLAVGDTGHVAAHEALAISANARLVVTGTTAAEIQATFDASSAGDEIFFPLALYEITAALRYPGNRKYVGSHFNGTTIRQAAGSAITTALLVPKGWYDNETTVGEPVSFTDITVDGNVSACPSSTAVGIIVMNWASIFERFWLSNTPSHGAKFVDKNSAGTTISTTAVENRICGVKVTNAGGHGIWIADTATKITDGYVTDCVVDVTAKTGIKIDGASGWKVRGNHLYGIGWSGIEALGAFATEISGNYVEDFGLSTTDGFYAGIAALVSGVRGTLISSNQVFNGELDASNTFQYIAVTGASGQVSRASVVGNQIRGAAQAYGKGFVYQSQGGGSTLTVDHSANRVENVHSLYRFVVDSSVTVLNGPVSSQAELATDYHGTATVATTFHSGSFTPESSQAVVTVAVSCVSTGASAAVELSCVIGGSSYSLGVLPTAVNGNVVRPVRVTGLLAGVAVAVAVKYRLLAAGDFYCRPQTQAEFCSFTAVNVS